MRRRLVLFLYSVFIIVMGRIDVFEVLALEDLRYAYKYNDDLSAIAEHIARGSLKAAREHLESMLPDWGREPYPLTELREKLEAREASYPYIGSK